MPPLHHRTWSPVSAGSTATRTQVITRVLYDGVLLRECNVCALTVWTHGLDLAESGGLQI